MGCGENQRGRLGTEVTGQVETFVNISSFGLATNVAVTHWNSLTVNQNGELFKTNQNAVSKIPMDDKVKWVMGFRSFYVVDVNGGLHSWGDNSSGKSDSVTKVNILHQANWVMATSSHMNSQSELNHCANIRSRKCQQTKHAWLASPMMASCSSVAKDTVQHQSR